MNYRTVTTLKSWINSGLLEHLTVTGISRHIELLMGSTMSNMETLNVHWIKQILETFNARI